MNFLLVVLTTYQLIYFRQPSIVSASGSVHEEIIQWWNKASVQKPIKCTINPSYLSPVNDLAMKLLENAIWKPILHSQPCGYNDVDEHFFIYKGNHLKLPINLLVIKMVAMTQNSQNYTR